MYKTESEKYLMSSSLNLTLTDELRAFIDRNCGDGTLYATPTEFMRDILREKKTTPGS